MSYYENRWLPSNTFGDIIDINLKHLLVLSRTFVDNNIGNVLPQSKT